MMVYVIEESLLDEGAPFEKKVYEVWGQKEHALARHAHLNRKWNGEGISYDITAMKVIG